MNLYEEKNLYLNSRFNLVSSAEFYRDLFPKNSFEEEFGFQENYQKTNKGNGFIVFKNSDDQYKTRFVFDNLKEIENHLENSTAFMSPISYFGKNRTSANARELFSMTFDLDEVGKEEIRLLFSGWIDVERIPRPTYVVNSGSGVHLYYVFEQSIPMYPNLQKQLKKMKYELTNLIWNGDTSKLKTKQFQGINQGFRLVGSNTKKNEKVIAYKTGSKINLEYLSSFVSLDNQIKDTFYHSKMTLEQAKNKFPEWYEQRIVQGRLKKNWTCKRDLYDWWKNKLPLAQIHHRYFYIMSLSVYAIKCGISFEELKKDAFEMQSFLNNLDKLNPFTKADIKSALEMYQECYRSFPRDEISKLSGIEIKANLRRGNDQKTHVKIMNFYRDIIHQNIRWRNENGRPKLKNIVLNYLSEHPNAKKCEVIRETKLSRPTVYKYYDECIELLKKREVSPRK